MKRLIYTLFLILAVSMVRADLSCGDTIESNTDYVLSSDISSAGTCFEIYSLNDVTIDCNGHTISSSSEEFNIGIDILGSSEITIKNCIIEKFGYGLYLDTAYSSTIDNVEVIKNLDTGILLSFSDGNTINNIKANNNGFTGMLMMYSNNNEATNSEVMGQPVGLFVSESFDNTFCGNTIEQNEVNIQLDYDQKYSYPTSESIEKCVVPDEIPEFGAIGATIALLGASLIVYKKRN